jgi:hypothetical protein
VATVAYRNAFRTCKLKGISEGRSEAAKPENHVNLSAVSPRDEKTNSRPMSSDFTAPVEQLFGKIVKWQSEFQLESGNSI